MSTQRFIVAETKSAYENFKNNLNSEQIVFIKDTSEIITQNTVFGGKMTEEEISDLGFTKNQGTITGVQINGNLGDVNNGIASLVVDIPSSVNDLGGSEDLVRYGDIQSIQNDIQTLFDQDSNLNNGISELQNKVKDIDTIRSGAELGATALQEVPAEYITETELTAKGYLTANDLQFANENDIDALFGEEV